MSSSSSITSLVWFLLLDSTAGEPYRGTSASSVSLPSGLVVDQFRDAVHVKNSSILTGIASSQLHVYKNKTAFDKRNDDVGKEEPLDPTLPLGALGVKEAPLIVVVPASNASNLPFISIPDKLKQLGVNFSTRDINYLINNDTPKYSLLILQSPQLTSEEAGIILTFSTKGHALQRPCHLFLQKNG